MTEYSAKLLYLLMVHVQSKHPLRQVRAKTFVPNNVLALRSTLHGCSLEQFLWPVDVSDGYHRSIIGHQYCTKFHRAWVPGTRLGYLFFGSYFIGSYLLRSCRNSERSCVSSRYTLQNNIIVAMHIIMWYNAHGIFTTDLQ